MNMRYLAFILAFLLALSPVHAQNVFFPANPGDMIVKGTVGAWTGVPGGLAGCVLMSQGPTAAPTWSCALPLNFALPPMAPNTVWGNMTAAQAPPTAANISQFLNTIDFDIQRPPLPGATIYKGTDNLWHTAPPATAGWVWTSQGAGAIPQWQLLSGPVADITVGSTVITGGVSNGILFNDAGSLGNTGSAPNAVLATDGSSVPAFTTTLPTAVQNNITRTGTVASGTWQGTVVGSVYGGLGVNAGASSGVPLFAAGVPTFTSTSGTGNFARVTDPVFGGLTLGGTIKYGNDAAVYPVTCDGTDDTTALAAAAAAAQANNLTIQMPVGTCIIGLDTALLFTSGNVVLQGFGQGISTLKAKNNARLTLMVGSTTTNQLTLRDFTIDANRVGFGMRTSANSSAVTTLAANTTLIRMEIKNAGLSGVQSFTPAANLTIDHSYLHDIGTNEVLANNVALGYFGGNVMPGLSISSSRFEDIHPTVTPLGDSAAINAAVFGALIDGNTFKNNYNVNGGQVAVSDNALGTADIATIISNNHCIQTGTFDSDLTGCYEANGSVVIVNANTCAGPRAFCVRTEGAGGGSQTVVVTNNIAHDFGAAIGNAAIELLATPIASKVAGNIIKSGTNGISVQNIGGTSGLIDVTNNTFWLVTNPIAVGALANITRATDNPGYNPVGVTASAIVGASPATICAGPSPETHYFLQSATNTATVSLSANVVGTMASATIPVVVNLGPQECEVITWVTTAPTYVKSVH